MKKYIVAKRLTAIAKSLYAAEDSILDKQFDAFCEWCEGRKFKAEQYREDRHEAVYSVPHYGATFQCRERNGDLEIIVVDEDGKRHSLVLNERYSPQEVMGRLSGLVDDLGISGRRTMPKDEFMRRLIADYCKVFSKIKGVERCADDDWLEESWGREVDFHLKVKRQSEGKRFYFDRRPKEIVKDMERLLKKPDRLRNVALPSPLVDGSGKTYYDTEWIEFSLCLYNEGER